MVVYTGTGDQEQAQLLEKEKIQKHWVAARLQLNLQKGILRRNTLTNALHMRPNAFLILIFIYLIERMRQQKAMEEQLQKDRERKLEKYSAEARELAEKRKREEEERKQKAKTQAQVEREMERARERERRSRLERTVNMDEQNLVMSGYQHDV